MKFVNNGTEAVKVKTEGNEKLPPVFRTVKPGETIEAESTDYIKGYSSVGLSKVIVAEATVVMKGVDAEAVVKKAEEPKTEPPTPAPKAKQSSKKAKKKK